MSGQDTSFEALAASPGDYAVDSEWMGDSPPALTVDFIQNNSHGQINGINGLNGNQHPPQQFQNGFAPAATAARGENQHSHNQNHLVGKERILSCDPNLTLSQPPTVSSPDSLLSSFQDSSSDISSKQTSMSALSSLATNGTPAKKTRGRPRGSGRSAGTGTSRRSTGAQSQQEKQLSSQSSNGNNSAATGADTSMTDDVMGDGSAFQIQQQQQQQQNQQQNQQQHTSFQGENGIQQSWNFRDYLRLDDEQEGANDASLGGATDFLGTTIDPRSIQRTPSVADADDDLLSGVAGSLSTTGAHNGSAAEFDIGTGPATGTATGTTTDLSPFSADPSPFDFTSATSSPNSTAQIFSAGGAGNVDSLNGSAQRRRGHSKALSQYSLSQSMNNLKTSGSREVSPVSNLVFSNGPSPSALLHNAQSPIDSMDLRFGQFTGAGVESMQMSPAFLFPDSVPTSPTSNWPGNSIMQQQQQQQQATNGGNPRQNSISPMFQQAAMPAGVVMNGPRRPLRFFVGVTPHKSRVETQIPIMIFLSALPPGVTRLHLPPHTISKPKLLAKPAADPSPDMLELHTMVVCTSAMQNEANRRRAMERAAAATHATQSVHSMMGDGSDGDEDCRPANGGEIWICKGCIQRERKRANRKKSKKPEDDEEWSREEHRRIIIFNTNEIKDWQRPTAAALSSLDENASGSPIEAVISVPMRITCYCRHHGEKTGFQVIFTLKDCRGQVIAQTISRSIMITDDHKTPVGPGASAGAGATASTAASTAATAASAGVPSTAGSIADGDVSAGDAQETSSKVSAATTPTSSAKTVAAGGSKTKATSNSISTSRSTPDLAAMNGFSTTPQDKAATAASSSTAAPRTHSRPSSPNGLRGHSSKKRKSSSGGSTSKVPTGLAMTQIETATTSPQQQALQGLANNANRTSASSASSAVPYPGASSFMSPSSTFAPESMAAAVDMALMAGGSGDPDIDSLAGIVPMATDPLVGGPLTPNSHTEQQSNGFPNGGDRSGSMDGIALSQAQASLYSAPTSSHASRAPSPTSLRGPMQMFQQHLFQQQQQQLQQQLGQAQFLQQFQSGPFGLPMAMSQAAAASAAAASSSPVIHKIIPNEGPKSGGIEVTVLGSAFYQGLDVMFGDQRATTTTFWGESSLVCLVPPSPIAGHVPVTLRQPNQRPAQPFVAPTQQRIAFKYLDDDEQQLLRAALTVLSRKMTGKIEDAQDVARRIIGSETSNWGTSGASSGSSRGGSAGGGAGGYAASLTAAAASSSSTTSPLFETQLLKVLELIDLDDSSNHTRLNMQRRTTGHSMLHLACVLGMHRFVAGLLARGANPDVRDNGGYTPLHLAALNNQPEIVRRLIHAGADPTMRTLSGLTAAEVAASREVVRAIKRFERHARSRSGGSMHSRTSSAASLRSLWEPMSMSAIRRASAVGPAEDYTGGDTSAETSSPNEDESSSYPVSGDDDDEDIGVVGEQGSDEEWLDMRPRSASAAAASSVSRHSRRSRRGTREASPRPINPSVANANAPVALPSPAAATMTAFKEHLAAQFQQFVAQFPQMPQNPLPDYYQAYVNSTAFQRISSLVPNISGSSNGSRPSSADGGDGHTGARAAPNSKELEGRWWDLSSLMAGGAAPPPAYEEIYPRGKDALDTKQATAAAAAAEAEADSKCATLYDQPTATASGSMSMTSDVNQRGIMKTSSTMSIHEEAVVADDEEQDLTAEDEDEPTSVSSMPALLQIGRKHQITKEQQENFRRVHKEKRKGLRADTFLYTVWIPILLGVLLLWLSGARAWDFFPSVAFNVPYATSLSSASRPTADVNDKSSSNHQQDKQVLAAPPAVANVPNDAGGAADGNILDVRNVGGLDGLVA